MEEKRVNDGLIRLVKGDVTQLEVDAFVYYARPDLALGSGFGTAIAARGGPSIREELKKLGPAGVGEALVTGAGDLKSKWIIHAVGPRFLEEQLEDKLRSTMQAALRRAEETGAATVAFPPMGAGFYGIPLDVCARVMTEEVQRRLEGQSGLKEVVFCVLDNREYGAFRACLQVLNERTPMAVRGTRRG